MAAGDVEGALSVVDAGDVAVWLSCFVGRWLSLSWFVGGQGCSWRWVLRVGDVVAGHCGGGGCGMKKEDVSLFVTCVTFASTFERARAIAPTIVVYSFVVPIIQFCSVQYTIV